MSIRDAVAKVLGRGGETPSEKAQRTMCAEPGNPIAFRNGTDSFTVGKIMFECWVESTGKPDEDGITSLFYVWRTPDRRGAVGRKLKTFWARVDSKLIGTEFNSLGAAMACAAIQLAKPGQ